MPPKKKEEEIDLASLPEVQSMNVVVLVRGKKSRAEDILRNIHKEAEKYLFRVKKNEVLEHAKEKNIYVDPATLTDKQKKDPKFMESICTELTPEVLAKAVQSHLTTLKLKARIVIRGTLRKKRIALPTLPTNTENTTSSSLLKTSLKPEYACHQSGRV